MDNLAVAFAVVVAIVCEYQMKGLVNNTTLNEQSGFLQVIWECFPTKLSNEQMNSNHYSIEPYCYYFYCYFEIEDAL